MDANMIIGNAVQATEAAWEQLDTADKAQWLADYLDVMLLRCSVQLRTVRRQLERKYSVSERTT